MEINFNASGSKFAKQDNLVALAENVAYKGKALAYLSEVEELDKVTILKLYDNNQAIIQGALKDLMELISDTLPTKYRPGFANGAFKIQQKIKRSYTEHDNKIIKEYLAELGRLKEKWGFEE